MRTDTHSRIRGIFESLVFPAALLLLWETCVDLNLISDYAFSRPWEIFRMGIHMVASGYFWHDVSISLERLATGISIGTISGLILAYWLYFSRISQRFVGPTLGFISQFPPVVWAPLLIAMFGVGEVSKVMLIALATTLVIYTATFQGLQSISHRLLEAVSVYKRPLITRIAKIYWPGSLPYFFEGLKTAIVFGWIVLLLAEMIGSEDGLGWLLWDARTFGRAPEMMVTLTAIGIIGKTLLGGINYAAQQASPWYGQYNGKRGRVWDGSTTQNRSADVQDSRRPTSLVQLHH